MKKTEYCRNCDKEVTRYSNTTVTTCEPCKVVEPTTYWREIKKSKEEIEEEKRVLREKAIEAAKKRCEPVEKVVLELMGVDKELFHSKTRVKIVVQARQIFTLICYEHIGSTIDIIRRYLQQNHATVHHSLDTLRGDIELNYPIKKDFEAAKQLVLNGNL